jgi:MOSC domain-containing protein YiiM
MFKVAYIGIRLQKGSSFQSLEHASVKIGHGIIWDLLSDIPERQISIYLRHVYKSFVKISDNGFCMNRFKPNLIMETTNPLEIYEKDRLRVGTCELEITVAGKNCHTSCPLFGKGETCDIHRNIYFAKVLKSGEIALFDEVFMRQDCNV